MKNLQNTSCKSLVYMIHYLLIISKGQSFMEFKDFVNKIMKQACVCFTMATLLYTLIVAAINIGAEEILISAERIILFFIFSFIFSLANSVLGAKSLSTTLRFFIHYILSMLACYFCLILPISPRPSDAVVGIALFSVLYFAVLAVALIIRSISKKIRERKEEYKDHYIK